MRTYQMVTGLIIVAMMMALVGILATPQEASAFGSIRNTWISTYPESTLDGANCQLCHQNPNGGNGWNAYGWSIRQQAAEAGMSHGDAILAVANLDADGNGTTNLDEINANFLPGWASGNVNTIYFKDGSTITEQAAPAGIGELDPETPPDETEQSNQWVLYLPIIQR